MHDDPLENSQVPSRQRDVQIGDYKGRYSGIVDNFQIFKFEVGDSSFSLYRAVQGEVRKIHIHGEIKYDCGNELTFQANLEEVTVLAIAKTVQHQDSPAVSDLTYERLLPNELTLNLALNLTDPEFSALGLCSMCAGSDFSRMGLADTNLGKSMRSLAKKVFMTKMQNKPLELDEGEAAAAYQSARNMVNVLRNPRPGLATMCKEEERPNLIERLESVLAKLTE